MCDSGLRTIQNFFLVYQRLIMLIDFYIIANNITVILNYGLSITTLISLINQLPRWLYP